jgi:hypothetical protein
MDFGIVASEDGLAALDVAVVLARQHGDSGEDRRVTEDA